MRIGITGAQSVGKTTLLNALRSEKLFDDYTICDEVTRRVKSYGLPIIEAKKFNLKIITSDSSFCFDLIKPDDFFNPYDCDSIARSVKRNIGLNKITNMILTPINFVNKFENI